MSKFLLLETATEICSIGLWEEGTLVIEKNAEEPYAHTRSITVLIQEALAAVGWSMKDIDAVGISAGPGSYTALRVGAATAKGICYAGDIPLIAISPLESLAYAMKTEAKLMSTNVVYIPMIDARRMEVYACLYDENLVPLVEEQAYIIDAAKLKELQNDAEKLILGGNGAEKCRDLLVENQQILKVACAARHLGPLVELRFKEGKSSDLAYFSPNYLKPPNITTPKPIWR